MRGQKPRSAYPFFINSRRWKTSESYFRENYRPKDLYDFEWPLQLEVPDSGDQNNTKLEIDLGFSNSEDSDLGVKFRPLRSQGTEGKRNSSDDEYLADWLGLKMFGCSFNRLLSSWKGLWKHERNVDAEIGPVTTTDEEFSHKVIRTQPESSRALILKRLDAMVEHEEENYFAYRRGQGGRQRRLQRVPSDEMPSNDSLVAGPPMINFNEPLPNVHQQEPDLRSPGPISNGDVGLARDVEALEVTLAHAAISNTSRENLPSVVSQLGLETPLPPKSSCHSPNHLHATTQPTCCRHAAHNISIESLDLDMNAGAGGSTMSHCCGHQTRLKRGMSRRSCSNFQY